MSKTNEKRIRGDRTNISKRVQAITDYQIGNSHKNLFYSGNQYDCLRINRYFYKINTGEKNVTITQNLFNKIFVVI